MEMEMERLVRADGEISVEESAAARWSQQESPTGSTRGALPVSSPLKPSRFSGRTVDKP